MGFWRRLFGGSSGDELKPQRLDYLNEALALERQGDYEAALTSYRLALRDHPNDARILQNMAIAFTKTRRLDEAIRHYRRAPGPANRPAGRPPRAPPPPPERGDAVSTAIAWATVDRAAFLEVVDPTTGVTAAERSGTGHLQARVGALRSNLLTVRVLAAADTVFAATPPPTTVTLSAPDSLSDSLGVLLQDTTAAGPVNLTGRPIVFTLTTYPAGTGPATLVTSPTAYALVTTDTVATSAGLAAVQVRILPGTPPDHVVVEATATRAVGTPVPGSPVSFVVVVQP